jgi:hypothetical protein
MKLVANVM